MSMQTLNPPVASANFRAGISGPRFHYMVLLANQRNAFLPHCAHSFAAFLEAEMDPRDGSLTPINQFVISWLPVSLKIAFLRFPEPGRNLDLDATFNWACTIKSKVSAWGPFRIDEMLFRKARQRYDYLETGITQYVVLDNFYRPFMASNCIHAISDLDLTPNLLTTGISYGIAASRKVAHYLRPWLIRPDRTHPQVAEILGLNRHDIQYLSLDTDRGPVRATGWRSWLAPRQVVAR